MKPTPVRRLLFLLPLLLWAALICHGSSAAAPEAVAALEVPDLLLHFAEFAVFGFLAARWVHGETGRTGATALLLLPALLSAAFGAADEVHQSFVPSRTPDPLDAAADAAGGLCGAIAWLVLLRGRRGARVVATAAVLGVLLFPPGMAHGDEDGTIRPEELRSDVEFLASPALRGRASPSAELDLAARFIAERFRAGGLEPLGDDWFLTFPVRFRRERGESFARRVGGSRFAGREVSVPAWSADGEGAGPLVFAGYGVEGPDGGDFAGLAVHGRVVVVLDGLPRSREEEARRDPELLRRASAEGKARAAAARGAVALLVVRGPGSGTVDRLLLRDGRVLEGRVEEIPGGYRVTRRGFRRFELPPAEIAKVLLRDGRELRPAEDPALARVVLPVAAETFLVPEVEAEGPPERGVPPLPRAEPGLGLLGEGGPPTEGVPVLLVSSRVVEDLFGLPVGDLEAAAARGVLPATDAAAVVRVRTAVEERPVRNVAGFYRGRDESAPVAVAVAHYDHLGTGPDGEIYAGADDNASGTAVLLALARALRGSGGPPRGSVVLLAVAAEELGLLGSRAFVRDPPLSLDRIGAVLNLDMVGRGAADELAVVAGPLGTSLGAVLSAAGEAAGLRLRLTVVEPPAPVAPPAGGRAALDLPVPDRPNPWFPRSDHASFYRKGIPVAFVFGGIHGDHHRPTDTPDRLNPDRLAAVARFALRAVLGIAEDGLAGGAGR
jgi:VanZ family protein